MDPSAGTFKSLGIELTGITGPGKFPIVVWEHKYITIKSKYRNKKSIPQRLTYDKSKKKAPKQGGGRSTRHP